MKLKFETLKGFKLHAQDGEIGKIKDVLFDDHQWGGRWLVADTRNWLPGRKVLLSPISFGEPDVEAKTIPVRMTQKEIRDAPPLAEDAPVSLQYEKTFYDQFYWPYYWFGGGLWANQTFPGYLDRNRNQDEINTSMESDPERGDHVLRSADELENYRVTSTRTLDSGTIGFVSDLVVDTETWSVPYLILKNRSLMPSKKILLLRERVLRTDWREHTLEADIAENLFDIAPSLEEEGDISTEMEDLAK